MWKIINTFTGQQIYSHGSIEAVVFLTLELKESGKFEVVSVDNENMIIYLREVTDEKRA